MDAALWFRTSRASPVLRESPHPSQGQCALCSARRGRKRAGVYMRIHLSLFYVTKDTIA